MIDSGLELVKKVLEEYLQETFEEIQEICDSRDAMKMYKKEEIYSEFDEFNEYFDKLIPRLQTDKLIKQLVKKTKDLVNLDLVVEEEQKSEPIVLEDPSANTDLSNVGSDFPQEKKGLRPLSLQQRPDSFLTDYERITVDLVQLANSVTINPDYVVDCILLLPNGDLVVDGRDKALVLDSNNFSYLLADFKKLGTNKETLSAGLLMNQKLVLGTLKGYVFVYKFNKDYKKDLSAKIQSSRIYCMT